MQTKNKLIEEMTFSTFVIDDMEFGIDVDKVREALFYKGKILKLPTGLDMFEGIINLRGNVIPVINMRKRFGLPPIYETQANCIAIVNYRNRYIGLIFDNISQVVRVDSSDVSSFVGKVEDDYFSDEGVLLLERGEKLLQVLDLDLVFKDCDIPILENASIENKKKFLEVKQDITFFLGGQEYALGMGDIQEIVNMLPIKNKVRNSGFVNGVITLRNELIPVVDLKAYLDGSQTVIEKGSKIIILKNNPLIGIIADSIKEVIHYEIDKLLPINQFGNGKLKDVFSNIVAISEDRNIIKINLDNLFSEDAKKQIKAGIHLNKDCAGQEQSGRKNTDNEQENLVLNKEFILFKLDKVFAIEIKEFQEIIKYPDSITEIPGSEDYIDGVLNLRSEAIFIINLRKYYNLPDYNDKKETKVLILNGKNKKIGIIVDDILEILKTDRVEVTKTPRLIAKNNLDSFQNHVKDILCVKKQLVDEQSSSLIILFDTPGFMSSIELNDSAKNNDLEEIRLDDQNFENLTQEDEVDEIADDKEESFPSDENNVTQDNNREDNEYGYDKDE